jgi:hypothetical protein
VLVRTGIGATHRAEGVSPDLTLASIAELPARLAECR